MSVSPARPLATENPIPLAKGTADWLPDDYARLHGLESSLLRKFALAGYDRLNTPVLEPVELHERKSGAGIVGKLFELSGQVGGRVCLRPELTAGIVRAYTAAEPAPPLPWRVSHAGPAFRRENPAKADRLREFRQVGVERLGDSGVFADAEVISLAWSTLEGSGVEGATLRLGHVGLTLEMLGRSGLPPTAQAALVEMLSEAAAEGGDVGSLGRGLDHFAEWLRQASGADDLPLPIEGGDDGGIDRLFRTLVPVINGRRPGSEIIQRLRRKWDLGHAWLRALDRVRDQARALADLKGSPDGVLDRLARDFEALAPDSVAALRALIQALEAHGVPANRLELDLGFGRGIGFYSQVVFEIVAPTPDGPVEVCGGGRYDGLARVFGSDRNDRGAGFAFGLERLDAALMAQGYRPDLRKPTTFLVVPIHSDLLKEAAEAVSLIRSKGFRAILEAKWGSGEMESRATALGATRILAVGPSGGESLLGRHEPSAQPTYHKVWGLSRLAALLDEEPKS
jgi:histidyl-tRNA synthetase